jgi:CRP-like cAMP-binding protein
MYFDKSGLIASVHRAVEAGTDRIGAKALVVFGFDLSWMSFEKILSRVEELVQTTLNFASALAILGGIFFVATLLMRTMVPLRISAIISNMCFVGYSILANSISTLLLYILLAFINFVRLYQMLKLVKKARMSAQGDLSMEWLKPFMHRRNYRKGEVLFLKGDPANEMFFTASGKYLVKEIGIELPAGRIVGELGFLSPNNRRTQTVECIETGEVLTITYDKLLEIYFQNPEFGYYFLRLSSDRLLQNNARLEATIERLKAEIEAAKIGKVAESLSSRDARQRSL